MGVVGTAVRPELVVRLEPEGALFTLLVVQPKKNLQAAETLLCLEMLNLTLSVSTWTVQ